LTTCPGCAPTPTPTPAPAPTPTPDPTPTPTPTPSGGGTCYVECCYDPYNADTGTYGATICNGYNIPCDQVNGWC
jgi:hypothetical protein